MLQDSFKEKIHSNYMCGTVESVRNAGKELN